MHSRRYLIIYENKYKPPTFTVVGLWIFQMGAVCLSFFSLSFVNFSISSPLDK